MRFVFDATFSSYRFFLLLLLVLLPLKVVYAQCDSNISFGNKAEDSDVALHPTLRGLPYPKKPSEISNAFYVSDVVSKEGLTEADNVLTQTFPLGSFPDSVTPLPSVSIFFPKPFPLGFEPNSSLPNPSGMRDMTERFFATTRFVSGTKQTSGFQILFEVPNGNPVTDKFNHVGTEGGVFVRYRKEVSGARFFPWHRIDNREIVSRGATIYAVYDSNTPKNILHKGVSISSSASPDLALVQGDTLAFGSPSGSWEQVYFGHQLQFVLKHDPKDKTTLLNYTEPKSLVYSSAAGSISFQQGHLEEIQSIESGNIKIGVDSQKIETTAVSLALGAIDLDGNNISELRSVKLTHSTIDDKGIVSDGATKLTFKSGTGVSRFSHRIVVSDKSMAKDVHADEIITKEPLNLFSENTLIHLSQATLSASRFIDSNLQLNGFSVPQIISSHFSMGATDQVIDMKDQDLRLDQGVSFGISPIYLTTSSTASIVSRRVDGSNEPLLLSGSNHAISFHSPSAIADEKNGLRNISKLEIGHFYTTPQEMSNFSVASDIRFQDISSSASNSFAISQLETIDGTKTFIVDNKIKSTAPIQLFATGSSDVVIDSQNSRWTNSKDPSDVTDAITLSYAKSLTNAEEIPLNCAALGLYGASIGSVPAGLPNNLTTGCGREINEDGDLKAQGPIDMENHRITNVSKDPLSKTNSLATLGHYHSLRSFAQRYISFQFTPNFDSCKIEHIYSQKGMAETSLNHRCGFYLTGKTSTDVPMGLIIVQLTALFTPIDNRGKVSRDKKGRPSNIFGGVMALYAEGKATRVGTWNRTHPEFGQSYSYMQDSKGDFDIRTEPVYSNPAAYTIITKLPKEAKDALMFAMEPDYLEKGMVNSGYLTQDAQDIYSFIQDKKNVKGAPLSVFNVICITSCNEY